MASWFRKLTPKVFNMETKSSVPAGVWSKCSKCNEMIYSKDLVKNLKVCSNCDHHMPIDCQSRIDFLFDADSFVEINDNLVPKDPLDFVDSKKYKDRVKTLRQKSNLIEAIRTGHGKIEGLPLVAGIFDFSFIGGSMGSVVGEKIALAAEEAINHKVPLLLISSSGGDRMQEGTLSLMQMAKTSAAIKRLKQHSLPYISLLTHPTTGGVTASFAMLGDIIIAEPEATIGFAGARVIRETIKKELPEGFQTAEFLLKHGSIDRVTHRKDLRKELFLLFSYMCRNNPHAKVAG